MFLVVVVLALPCVAAAPSFQFVHGPASPGSDAHGGLAAVVAHVDVAATGTGGAVLLCGGRPYRTLHEGPLPHHPPNRTEFHVGTLFGWASPPGGSRAVFVAADNRGQLLGGVRRGCELDVGGVTFAADFEAHPCDEGNHITSCHEDTRATLRAALDLMHAASEGLPDLSYEDSLPPPRLSAPGTLPMHTVFTAGGNEASFQQETTRKCIRHGHGGPVVGHTSVTPDQEASMALLQVAHYMGNMARDGELGETGAGTRAGTIYEIVIHPATNAFAYLTPRIVYLIAREAVTDLLTNLLSTALLDPLTLPGIAALDPTAESLAAASFAQVGEGSSTPMGETAGLPKQLEEGVVTDVATTLVEAIGASLPERVTPMATGYIVRKVARLVVFHTSKTVMALLPPAVMARAGPLITSRVHDAVTTKLLPRLSHALTASIAHSISRNPADDRYCQLCAETKKYCEFCSHSKTVDRVRDHVTKLYTSYFSSYYSDFYRLHFRNVAVGDFFVPTAGSGDGSGSASGSR